MALVGEIDAMGVVDEAVEDGVGIGRVADDSCHLSMGIWLVTVALLRCRSKRHRHPANAG
jgi:hypothetical protein